MKTCTRRAKRVWLRILRIWVTLSRMTRHWSDGQDALQSVTTDVYEQADTSMACRSRVHACATAITACRRAMMQLCHVWERVRPISAPTLRALLTVLGVGFTRIRGGNKP